MSKPIITQTRLKEILSYDAESGLLTWKTSTSNRVKVGAIAGTKMNTVYIAIGIDGPQYLAHRLAFLYITGGTPFEVDHIDHNPCNNRFTNLRPVSHQQNGCNQRLRKTNTSGFMGVRWDTPRNKWHASIRANGKKMFLGRFASFEEAKKVRLEAEAKYGFHQNHGS
jgi:hypothetical protein